MFQVREISAVCSIQRRRFRKRNLPEGRQRRTLDHKLRLDRVMRKKFVDGQSIIKKERKSIPRVFIYKYYHSTEYTYFIVE